MRNAKFKTDPVVVKTNPKRMTKHRKISVTIVQYLATIKRSAVKATNDENETLNHCRILLDATSLAQNFE